LTFVGRVRELDELAHLLEQVRRGNRGDRGMAVNLRGRRRVGKSRLASEFVIRAGVPYAYFQAARGAPVQDELAELALAIASSTLPAASIARDQRPTSLTAALTMLASALPEDTPSIIVIDEVPWLLEGIPGGAGELQRAWDRALAPKPVLLLLLGSDLAMMERLNAPDQPFHGRSTPMVLNPLTPSEIARITGLDAFDAFDAYLITGGSPLAALEWESGMSRENFLRESFTRSTSALIASGSRVLDSEFPEWTLARTLLSSIGARGERTFTGIRNAVTRDGMSEATILSNLRALLDKQVVAADEPLSARRAIKDRRWRIADPSLRFWLAFVEPALGEVDRSRPDLAMNRVNAGYESWRGRAIEPVVRAGLERLLPNGAWPTTAGVGGWWPRNNTPEIDLVGTDARPSGEVTFVGSIKWRQTGSITAGEIDDLARSAVKVPGASALTPLVAVTGRQRSRHSRLSECWTAQDLLAAWP